MEQNAFLELLAHHIRAFDGLTNVINTLLVYAPIPAVEAAAAREVLADAKAYVDRASAAIDAQSAAAAPAPDPLKTPEQIAADANAAASAQAKVEAAGV